MNKLRIISLCAAALLLLASCAEGGGDTNAPPTFGAPKEAQGVACGLIPPETIALTLGIPGLGAPSSTWISPMRTCQYPLRKNPAKVIISYLSGVTRDSFANERERAESGLAATATTISGLGDAAYSFAFGSTTSLSVLAKNVRVMITASVSLEREKKLAALIIDKL